ncbi:MAG: hypothetical protein ACRDMV_04860 [Streptosporangiales bacterium]
MSRPEDNRPPAAPKQPPPPKPPTKPKHGEQRDAAYREHIKAKANEAPPFSPELRDRLHVHLEPMRRALVEQRKQAA